MPDHYRKQLPCRVCSPASLEALRRSAESMGWTTEWAREGLDGVCLDCYEREAKEDGAERT